MYQKFIINQDGLLRFGTVFMHVDLLNRGEDCPFGGGLWKIDTQRNIVLLYGRSFDFGLPDFSQVKSVDWHGVGGSPLPLLYLPNWPDESNVQPIII